MALMEASDILKILPHRYPFLLVDRVLEIEPGKRIVAVKNVTANEPFFIGHFPDFPVMPGVLIIESMAQTAGALVVMSLGPEAEGKVVYFMSIEGAKFRKPVVPGDRLFIHCVKERNRGPVWKFNAVAKVDGVTVAEATYSAMLMDRAAPL